MSYFEYKVVVWEDDEERTYYGVTYGREYQDAVREISMYFDEAAIISISVEAWDVEGCLTMSKEALEDIKSHLV